MFALEMVDQFDEMAATFEPPVDEVSRLASAFKGFADKSQGLTHLHRYETRSRRAFGPASTPSNSSAARRSIHARDNTTAGGSPVAQLSQKPPKKALNPVPKPPAKKPAAQQLPPDPEKLQNEIRREAIRRVRITFGHRIPIRLIPPKRRQCR